MNKIVFFVADDWSFCNYRWAMATALQAAGYEIHVVTRVEKYGDKISGAGFILHALNFERGAINPWQNLKVLRKLIAIYQKINPDVVHHFAVKSILLGTLAAKRAKVPRVINSFTGLGYIFTTFSLKALLLRQIIGCLWRRFAKEKNIFLTVQNEDDRQFLLSQHFATETRIALIRGSGVDTNYFFVQPEPSTPVVITMVCRMLKDKGVTEFVEAAKIIKRNHADILFKLVGSPDPHNPASLTETQLMQWHASGVIHWEPFSFDIRGIWQMSHIAVLLSQHREGLPRALLEAGACGKPLVATDVPGCRALVSHGKNGLLVKPREVNDIVKRLERLITDASYRLTLGLQARQDIEKKFSDAVINQQFLMLYENVLKTDA